MPRPHHTRRQGTGPTVVRVSITDGDGTVLAAHEFEAGNGECMALERVAEAAGSLYLSSYDVNSLNDANRGTVEDMLDDLATAARNAQDAAR